MRFGAPVPDPDGPDAWIESLQSRGFTAAYWPLDHDADADTVAAYADAARAADVTVAEVGAWGVNPISPDRDERDAAIAHCARALEVADAVGANCAVNVAGSRDPDRWDGPHPDNFDAETVDRIVESVRSIVDRADPDEAVYALEPMPWVPPDGVESQRRLLEAVDREAFGVHLDTVNVLTSPRRVRNHVGVVERFVEVFADDVAAVHLKDARLGDELTVHIEETPPGEGDLDLAGVLEALDELPEDVPVLLEHLPDQAAYDAAAERVREAADDVGVSL